MGSLDWLLDAYAADKGWPSGSSQAWALLPGRRFMGSMDVRTILGGNLLEDYRAARLAAVSGPTVRREMGALKAAFRWGLRGGRVPRALSGGLEVGVPAEGAARTTHLNTVEEARLWAYARGRFLDTARPFRERRGALFVCLALETAAREGAIRGLTWDRVDLRLDGSGKWTGLIDFRDPGVRVSRKRRVPVPVSDRLMEVLLAARAGHLAGVAPGRFVLDHPGEVKGAWRGIKSAPDVDLGWVNIHDLRRTWATLRVQWGVPLEEVAAVLGDSIEIVERHYAHYSPGFLRRAVNARAGVGHGNVNGGSGTTSGGGAGEWSPKVVLLPRVA